MTRLVMNLKLEGRPSLRLRAIVVVMNAASSSMTWLPAWLRLPVAAAAGISTYLAAQLVLPAHEFEAMNEALRSTEEEPCP